MLAIVIPFRAQPECDREAQLRAQLAHLRPLGRERDVAVVVVRQSADGQKFNRGQLLNEGFARARALGASHVCFHDVDLLLLDLAAYGTCCDGGPVHLAAAFARYASPRYFGGVVLCRAAHVEIINGFPNDYFGWGGEDDAMLQRVGRTNLRHARVRVPLRDLEGLGIDAKLRQLRAAGCKFERKREALARDCLLKTSDAADEYACV